MFSKNFIKEIAKKEKVSPSFLGTQLRQGRAVITVNNRRMVKNPCAIGKGFKVKINTNIGVSTANPDIKTELEKLRVAVKAGADTVMDLSVGDDLNTVRRAIIAASPVPVGTVPMYQIVSQVERRKGDLVKITFDDIWDVLKCQAEEGVDFFTLHAGILKKTVKKLKTRKRTGGIVSRGGAILTRWIYENNKENPIYENFDKILDLAHEYNITLSLGDALRPGAIADSTDEAQISELKVLGELVTRCRKAGVQAMVEGPGHIRIDEIAYNMRLQKKICHGAPFYVLGPLPTDIAAGYDHITGAIGGAIAAMSGADFLCVVTPAEHLRHPSIDDIKDGTIASKIAAHSVDVIRFKDEWERDKELSLYRSRRDWESQFPRLLDEEKAREYRRSKNSAENICSMCGDYCALKIVEKCKLLK